MSKIQIVLDADDWYKVIDALKFSEFDRIISSETLSSETLSSSDFVRDELIKERRRDSLAFGRLSEKIYGQICSGAFREGYELKEKELEQEKREKLDSDCDF